MSIEQTIFLALTAEYWNRYGYSTRRMAEAAVKAVKAEKADLNALEAIIVRNLIGPNFVTMAKEVKQALRVADASGQITIETKNTSTLFVVAESATGGWCWESFANQKLDECLDSSTLFDFPEEAYQDAIRHAHEQEQEWVDGREEREAAFLADLSVQQKIEDRQDTARGQ